jgi:MFS family permease
MASRRRGALRRATAPERRLETRGDAKTDTYRRVILATLSLTEIVSWGVLVYAFPVFIKPMESDFGWTRAELSGAFSVALLSSAVAAIPAGRWLDRHGPRGLMTAGSLVAALTLLAWTRVSELWHVYVLFVPLGVAMALTLYEPAFATVAAWFAQRSPRRALTVLTIFGGLASTVFTPLVTWLLHVQGWRDALLTLAVLVVLFAAAPHGAFLRRAPAASHDDVPKTPASAAGSNAGSVSAGQAVRGAAFWLITAAVVISNFITMAINVHLISYLLERGFAAPFVAVAVGLIGAVQLPGRALLLPLGARLPRPTLAALVFGLQGIGLLVLLAAAGPALVLAFVVAFGLGKGMVTLLRAALLAEFYGAAHYGTIGGVVAAFIAGSQAVAPLAAGMLYDRFGSYDPIMALLAGAAAIAAVSAAMAERVAPGARTPIDRVTAPATNA